MDKVSMSHVISFSRYQKNVFLSSYLDSWWWQTLRFFLDQTLKQWLTAEKRAEDKNTKNWITREWKELSRWNKKPFS